MRTTAVTVSVVVTLHAGTTVVALVTVSVVVMLHTGMSVGALVTVSVVVTMNGEMLVGAVLMVSRVVLLYGTILAELVDRHSVTVTGGRLLLTQAYSVKVVFAVTVTVADDWFLVKADDWILIDGAQVKAQAGTDRPPMAMSTGIDIILPVGWEWLESKERQKGRRGVARQWAAQMES